MTHFRKTATAAFAALSMGATLIGSTGEAKAWCGYYGCGYGAGAVAAGVAGGLALGAIAAAAAHQEVAPQRYGSRTVRARRVSQR